MADNDVVYKDNLNVTKLAFHGGPIVSALPMLFFIIWAISCSLLDIANEKSLIIGSVIGLGIGMFVCKSSPTDYLQALTEGMTQSVAAVAIIAWFWAGSFAAILQTGGLVDGLVWAGLKTRVSGSIFTALTFILSATFGTAVGTGYGTLVSFTMLMYPAGILMGSNPYVLMGAILSGSAFGDNLAPVSDTTIISAATQETDIMGVVRTRFKYSVTAGIIATILFLIFGGNGNVEVNTAMVNNLTAQYANPRGLILLIPFALVLFLAFRGHNLIYSISIGIITSTVLIVVAKLGKFSDILHFDLKNATVTGAIADGVGGYLHMCVLLLLIMAAGYLIVAGDLMALLEKSIVHRVDGSVKKAELAIWSIVAILNALMSVNAAAEITAAPFVKSIGNRFNIHPYRRANMLDAISAAGGFTLPWSGGVLLAVTVVNGMLKQYPFLTQLKAGDIWYYCFHGWALIFVMLFAAFTSWDLTYKGENGEPVKAKEYKKIFKE